METPEVKLYKKPTMESLKATIKDNKKEFNRRKLAISLDICPECGAPLVRQNSKKITVKKRRFLPNKTRRDMDCDYLINCSNNKDHYSHRNWIPDYPDNYGY